MKLVIFLLATLFWLVYVTPLCAQENGEENGEGPADIEVDGAGKLAKAGPIQEDFGYVGFVFYFLPKPRFDPVEIFTEFAAGALPEVPAEAMVTEVRLDVRGPMVGYYTEKAPLENFNPPDENMMPFVARGLSDEQKANVGKSDRAFIVRLAYAREDVWKTLHLANKLAADFAEKTNALVWDSTTRELFTPEAFRNLRLNDWDPELGAPDIRSQISVNLYRMEDNGFCRAVTLGMRKIGLPDLAIEHFSWSDHKRAAQLIHLVGQKIAEDRGFQNPGEVEIDISKVKQQELKQSLEKSLLENGTGIARVQMLEGKRRDGDASNRLLEVGFGLYPGDNVQQRQANLFEGLFGSKDPVVEVKFGSATKAASEKAKAMLPALRTRFNNGLPDGESILLKAPFKRDDGGKEWMWVEVTEWERRGEVKGILRNDAQSIKGMISGMEVTFDEADVFDFLMHKADGSVEGNQTGKLARERAGDN